MMKKLIYFGLPVLALLGIAFWWSGSPSQLKLAGSKPLEKAKIDVSEPIPFTMPAGKENLQVATFAGGCFWCVEEAYEKVPEGVYEVTSGYTGGMEKNPGYYDVAKGRTGHTEAVQLYYDPKIISYEGLLQVLFRTADPTDAGGQYYDRGSQYRPGIYYHNDQQYQTALRVREEMDKSGRWPKPVVLEIKPYTGFYEAEEFHQDYAKKNPVHYLFYTHGSGRVDYQEKIWGDDLKIDFSKYRPTPKDKTDSSATGKISDSSDDMPLAKDMVVPVSNDGAAKPATSKEKMMSYKKPPIEEIKKRLTPLQFKVTQHEGTERPFQNEYWDNKKDGIYVDIVSGEPLFSSKDKYKSGTGWPSFTKPLDPDNIVEKVDRKLFMTRTEVRSKHGDSHLGHVFEDGPQPTGLRYCMNSASMRFIAKEDLEKEGYGEYLKLFQ